MNKTQLIDVVAKSANLKKKDAEVAVSAALDAIVEALVAGDKVQLIGFGSFEVKERGEREGHNPATGEKIVIPASKNVGFSASKALKDKVNA
jgi:DNA-binding protein HU-beta